MWWDPTAGKKADVLVNTETQKVLRAPDQSPMRAEMLQMLDPEMAAMAEARSVGMGEICVELRNFFQIFPDPHATEDGLETCEWVGERATYSRDYVERHFPNFAERLSYDAKPTSGVSRGVRSVARFAASAEAGAEEVRGIELDEYWSHDRHVIWSKKDQIILLEESNPYPCLPYVMFGGTPVPGQFYPDCITTQLVPRQVSLNKVLSQIEENAGRIGNPPFLRPSTMSDDDWHWSGKPGEEVVYNDTGSPGAVPSFMQVPELPGYVQNLPSLIENSMREISGQHEVTGSNVPAGVTAASAINLLQEQDDTRLGPDVEAMAHSLEEVGTRILWLVGKYYTDERHLKITGEDGAWDVMAFKGSMLRGQSSIEVQIGAGMPQSKAAKQAAIQQVLNLFIQNGVQMDERSLRRVLSQYEVGGLEQFFATQQRDTRQVQEENRKMALPDAQPLDINAFDNDDIHIAEHEDFQKSARYGMLSTQHKQMFEMHVEAHRIRQSDMQENQAMQQAMLGAPPPPDGPPMNGAVPSQEQPTQGGVA